MTSCRDCDERIMFVHIENTGTPMPVNPYPDPDGNVFARYLKNRGGLLGHVAHKDEQLPDGWRVYMPHFATCRERRVGGVGGVTEPVESAPAEPDQAPTLFGQTEGTQP